MKLETTIAKIGIIGGIAWSIFFAARYGFVYPDMDRVILFVAVGSLICFASWTYDKLVHIFNEEYAVGEKLEDFQRFVNDRSE